MSLLSCSARDQRTINDRGYSQRNIRNQNQRQIADSDETMPTDDTTTTTGHRVGPDLVPLDL